MQLKLQAEPTFEAKVPIHVPGKGPVDMSWTFKYRNRDELDKFMVESHAEEMGDVPYLMAIACGWGLAEPFTEHNIQIFITNYYTAVGAVVTRYMEELTGHKLDPTGAKTKN